MCGTAITLRAEQGLASTGPERDAFGITNKLAHYLNYVDIRAGRTRTAIPM
jgi:hypothetical protein